MNKKNLIIMGLVIVIIALLVGIGVAMMAPSKENVKLTINSNDTIYEGDSIEIKLSNINNTPIANETVSISIKDENGTADYHSVVTDPSGIGKLELNKSVGNYTVHCKYEENEKYVGNTASKNITVKKMVQKTEVSQQESSSTSGSTQSSKSEYGSYINDEWVSMSEEEYAERYPVLYHQRTLAEGRYDQYHPGMYEVDRENGRI